MRTLLYSLLLIGSLAHAQEDQWSGLPKDCYLYCWGKGPNWTAKVTVEFRLSLLDRLMQYVDDQYFEPTEKALTWVEKQKEPKLAIIASVHGRRVAQVIYPEERSFGKTIGTIL
ncbi:MAG: hypothetical protein RIS79_3067 [Verrucomicrobiota bacterium]|jgi:hypothetical protein